MHVKIQAEPFGTLPSGESVHRFHLTNRIGASVSLTDYGAILTSIVVPDREGHLGEVTVGHRELAGYLGDSYFLGAVVGRYANRIARGRFELDGRIYQLPKNNGENHLHGGPNGFYRRLWKTRTYIDETGAGVELRLHSADGDEGYPGALDVSVRYHFDDDCRLSCDYEAQTNQSTVVNLTQHSYFNLAGRGTVLDHELRIWAQHFTPTDVSAIPTGVLAPVADTPFDFRDFYRVGARIDQDDPQLVLGGGYDHNFVLDGESGQLRRAAELYCPATGRRLTVTTTEPGMQLYTGNFLPKDGSLTHGYREALCLETQHFPDSPNHAEFPSTRLEPGQRFRSRTVFAFAVTSR